MALSLLLLHFLESLIEVVEASPILHTHLAISMHTHIHIPYIHTRINPIHIHTRINPIHVHTSIYTHRER